MALETVKKILERAKTEGRELTAGERSVLAAADAAAEREARKSDGTKPPLEDPDPTWAGGRAPAVHTHEERSFSLFRSILASAGALSRSETKVERWVADALRERRGEPHRPGALHVPFAALLSVADERKLHERVKRGELELRDVEKTGAATGAALVATDLLPQEFIPALRPATRVLEAGATVVPNLVGDVDIPRQSDVGVGVWLATETTALTEDEVVTNAVSLTPKTVAWKVEITRRMQKQSSIGIEDLVRADFRAGLGVAVDAGAISGSGMAGQPTGILNTMGIGGVTTGGGLTVPELVEFWSDVAGANAAEGRLAYMTRASIAATMMTTTVDTGSGIFILGANRQTVNGFPCYITNQIPAQTMIFGNWAEVLVGMWGGPDVFADPYSLGNTGHLVVRGFQDVDVALKHAASFSAATDI